MTRSADLMRAADIDSLVIDYGRAGALDAIPSEPGRLVGWARYLNQIVVDSFLVQDHIRYVQKTLAGRRLPKVSIAEEHAKRFLQAGGSVLSPSELTAVLLDPGALVRLHDLVDEEMPQFFAGYLSEAVREDLRSHGVEPPPSPLRPESVVEREMVTTRDARGPAETSPERRWSVHAKDCQWRGSSESSHRDAPSEPANIRAQWFSDRNVLDVRIGGFLGPGRGSTVTVTLFHGEQRVEACSRSLPLLSLAIPGPLTAGATLLLKRESADGAQCSVMLTWE